MQKSKQNYACENCGAEYVGWQGQCTYCKEWNTIVEQKIEEIEAQTILKLSSVLTKVNLAEIEVPSEKRISTKISEFDRVLGTDNQNLESGLMPGSVILLTGEPGIGKSTLLLQLAINLSQEGEKILYISGEESISQIASRAKRLNSKQPNVSLVNSYDLTQILELIKKEEEVSTIILDSIQTISSMETRGIAGGMSQIKYCAALLISTIKQLNKSLIIVGHINKEGTIAGPKLLEHLVDVVLLFSGEDKSSLRILRATKNRYGSTDELGLFNMQEDGLLSITNPADFFLSEGESTTKNIVAGTCPTIVVEGKRPLIMEIQALVIPTNFSLPKRVSEGISLARVQMICAVLTKYLKLNLANSDIYINIPQGFKVSDRGIDLAVAIAIISSAINKPLKQGAIAFGEISLSGSINLAMFQKKRVTEVERLGYLNLINKESIKHVSNLLSLFK